VFREPQKSSRRRASRQNSFRVRPNIVPLDHAHDGSERRQAGEKTCRPKASSHSAAGIARQTGLLIFGIAQVQQPLRPRLAAKGRQGAAIDHGNRDVQCAGKRNSLQEKRPMFGIGHLFQWERFVTPTVIKVFYWLAVVISVMLGVAGAVTSLTTMAFNPFVGMIFLITSVLGASMGVIASRIAAEFVLIVFRINEHLGAIRNQESGSKIQ
jgi:hypothetical protein